ncbi:MAG: FkbM family methyltransferase [Bacteroidetes bacterium]|nr:FkbM family methyltransferase [Bacteroidota bacterium]
MVIKKGQAGITGNLYSGLHEFEEMMFVIHYLDPGDIFLDVGSNVGIYTLLSSALRKAVTYSFEPVPSTYYFLKMNVAANNLESMVTIQNKGVGNEDGKLIFASDADAMNKVVQKTYTGKTIETEVIKLDSFFLDKVNAPTMLKVDTEGYEYNVLSGGSKLLDDERVKVVLVEANEPEKIYGLLSAKGFIPHAYSPQNRLLSEIGYREKANIIYVRDVDFVNERLGKAEIFTIRGKKF